MSREWKPGDVGVTGSMFSGEVPTRFLVCSRDGGLRFDYADGDTAHFAPRDDARPLVAIDPEDREQVERLCRQFVESGVWGVIPSEVVDTHEHRREQVAVALREFANPTPPKPEEPTGLGAVVEDAEGDIWVRVDGDAISLWHHGGRFPKKWQDITAVRVLSVGVTA